MGGKINHSLFGDGVSSMSVGDGIQFFHLRENPISGGEYV